MGLIGRGGWFTLSRLRTNIPWYERGAGDEVALDSFFGPSGAPTAYTLTAASGAFALTGINAALISPTLKLTANAGAFVLTGIAATTRVAHKLVATSGAFTLTGVAAVTRVARKLIAASRSFALTGYAANLVVTITQRLLTETGSLLLVGKNVDLVYAALVHYTIAPLPGGFVMTGKDALLRVPLTRQPGRLRFGRPVPVTWRL